LLKRLIEAPPDQFDDQSDHQERDDGGNQRAFGFTMASGPYVKRCFNFS